MRWLLMSTLVLVLLEIAGPARAGAEEPTTEPAASTAFIVRLAPDISKENVSQRIVEAGHEQLAAACGTDPAASVRVLNPLASGEYADVACSTILDGGEAVGQSSQALTSGGEELAGQAQQPITPAGPILCGLASLIATTAGASACASWRGKNSEFCDVGNFGSGAAWVFACALML